MSLAVKTSLISTALLNAVSFERVPNGQSLQHDFSAIFKTFESDKLAPQDCASEFAHILFVKGS